MIIRTEGIRELIAELGAMAQEQIPYATALTITSLAGKVQAAETGTIASVFDRPTPYAINSIFKTSATKTKLTAKVWLKDRSATSKGNAATDYLAPQILGGTRNQKPFEYWLTRAAILPAGWVTVPGRGATINQYGNISQGQITQILSAMNATPDTYQNSRRLGRVYVILWKPGTHIVDGIYKMVGGQPQCVLKFVRQANYKPLFKFYEVAETVIEREWEATAIESWQRALDSAR